MNTPFRNLGCLLATFVLVPVVAWLLFEAYHKEEWERTPFPLERLERLGSTMRTQDVAELLGPPTRAFLWTNDLGHIQAEWVYSGGIRAPIVYVSFNPDGDYEKYTVSR